MTLAHRCVVAVVDALFCAVYGDSAADEHATRRAAVSSVCAGAGAVDDETLPVWLGVAQSLESMPSELRAQLSLELQRRWTLHVQQLKTTKSHWWRDVAEPDEAEMLLWTALGLCDDTQELQVAVLPPWYLSAAGATGCSPERSKSLNLLALDFTGVEWYKHPEEVAHSLTRLQLSNLQSLVLHNQDVLLDEQLELVVALAPRLASLDISYCTRLTDSGVNFTLQSLCKTLQSLSCNGLKRLTSNGVRALEGCRELQSVKLEGCLSIDQLPALEAHPQLTHVNLRGVSGLSDSDVASFLAPHWSRLQVLRLGETEISTSSLTELTAQLSSPTQLTALRELDLSWCSRCDDAELGSVFKTAPMLTTLKLRCLSIQDCVLRGLGSSSCYSRLQILDLERCSGLTDLGFAALVSADSRDAAMGSLEKINVSWTAISSALLGKLMAKNARTLRKICLQGCRFVDSTVLSVFDECCEVDDGEADKPRNQSEQGNPRWPQLEWVDCKWVDAIRDDHILESARHVPGVTFVGYYGSKTTFRSREQ